MQLGIEPQIPDGLLAANALLAENSRQGVPTSRRALHQGFEFAISSTVLGFQFRCSESASDPVVATSNAPDPMKPTPTYNKCNQQAIAAAGPLVPDGQSIATTAVTTAASWLFPGTTWFKLARGIVTGQFSRLIVKAAVYNANFEGCMSAKGVVIPQQQY